MPRATGPDYPNAAIYADAKARALAAGIPASDVVFSGVGKTVAELTTALEAGLGQFNLELEEEGVVLAGLAAALVELAELLRCAPMENGKGAALQDLVRAIQGQAQDICGECVPREYAPHLSRRMDRVREAADSLM